MKFHLPNRGMNTIIEFVAPDKKFTQHKIPGEFGDSNYAIG